MSISEPPLNPGEAVTGYAQGIEALLSRAEEVDVAACKMLLAAATGYYQSLTAELAKARHPSYNLTPQEVKDAVWRAGTAKAMLDAMAALASGRDPGEDILLDFC